MKSLSAIALALTLLSSASFAAGVSLNVVSLKSEMKNHISRIKIVPQENGQVLVTLDPNHCGNLGPCTQIAVSNTIVTPEVIVDERPRDGNLTLKLTESLKLVVGSGYNIEEHVTYTAVETDKSGQVTSYLLRPEVHLQLAH